MSSFEVANKNDESPGLKLLLVRDMPSKYMARTKKTSKPKPKQPEAVKS